MASDGTYGAENALKRPLYLLYKKILAFSRFRWIERDLIVNQTEEMSLRQPTASMQRRNPTLIGSSSPIEISS